MKLLFSPLIDNTVASSRKSFLPRRLQHFVKDARLNIDVSFFSMPYLFDSQILYWSWEAWFLMNSWKILLKPEPTRVRMFAWFVMWYFYEWRAVERSILCQAFFVLIVLRIFHQNGFSWPPQQNTLNLWLETMQPHENEHKWLCAQSELVLTSHKVTTESGWVLSERD